MSISRPQRPKKSGPQPVPTRETYAPAWLAVSRGAAIFLGAFCLLTVASELRQPGPDSDLIWIDLRPAPLAVARAFLATTGMLLLAFGVSPRLPTFIRLTATFCTTLTTGIAIGNAIGVYRGIQTGPSHGPLIPIALNLAALLGVVLAGMTVPSGRSAAIGRDTFFAFCAFLLCAVSFPLAQMACFLREDVPESDATVLMIPDAKVATVRKCLSAIDRTDWKTAIDGLLVPAPDGQPQVPPEFLQSAAQAGIPSQAVVPISPATSIRDVAMAVGERLGEHKPSECVVVVAFHRAPRALLWLRRSGVRASVVSMRDDVTVGDGTAMLLAESSALWSAWLAPVLH